MSNARFSILQAKAVKDKNISDSQFRTLAALGMYSDQDGWCYPLLQTLGDDLGKSKQAVGRDTIALRKLGYLEVTARYTKEGSRRSSLYRLIFDTPRQRHVDTPSTPEVDVNAPKNAPKNKKKGDIFDGMQFYAKQAIEQGQDKVEEMLDRLERELNVNLTRSTSNQQIAKKIIKANEKQSLDTFITWLKSDEWRAAHLYIYTDLVKLWAIYPQAFAKTTINNDGKGVNEHGEETLWGVPVSKLVY